MTLPKIPKSARRKRPREMVFKMRFDGNPVVFTFHDHPYPEFIRGLMRNLKRSEEAAEATIAARARRRAPTRSTKK